MSRHGDILYIHHIADACHRIMQYTAGLDAAAFASSGLVQDAVIRQLEIIGEASNKVSRAFQAEHPDISWTEMKGLRNVLIHDYPSVVPSIVWDIAKNDLPVLLENLNCIFSQRQDAAEEGPDPADDR
ncbi:MAG: DUF86 domain-containing protein [Thermaerobacter sp.]|nr:DUF86 domain-containing protein [Thermaerobacter sp.]